MTEGLIEGAGIASEIILLAVLLKRKCWKMLPVLTVLAAFTPLEDLTLIAVSCIATNDTYFWTFWAFALCDYTIQVALIYEIARTILMPAGSWMIEARRRFICLSIIGSLSAFGLVLWTVRQSTSLRELLYIRASLLTSLVTCVCCLVLSLTANRYRLPRSSHTSAIGLGLATWNIASIIGDVSRSTGVSVNVVAYLDYARMLVDRPRYSWTI